MRIVVVILTIIAAVLVSVHQVGPCRSQDRIEDRPSAAARAMLADYDAVVAAMREAAARGDRQRADALLGQAMDLWRRLWVIEGRDPSAADAAERERQLRAMLDAQPRLGS
jgi:hypothetical protein